MSREEKIKEIVKTAIKSAQYRKNVSPMNYDLFLNDKLNHASFQLSTLSQPKIDEGKLIEELASHKIPMNNEGDRSFMMPLEDIIGKAYVKKLAQTLIKRQMEWMG